MVCFGTVQVFVGQGALATLIDRKIWGARHACEGFVDGFVDGHFISMETFAFFGWAKALNWLCLPVAET